MELPSTTVVLVNWRTAGLTVELLTGVFAEYPELTAFVLDNGSGDGSAEHLAAFAASEGAGSRVVVEASAANPGFTAGMNRAVAAAMERFDPELLWLMNPDSRPGAGVLRELQSVLEESGAAVAVSRMLSDELLWAGDRNYPRAFWARPKDYRWPPTSPRRWWPSDRFEMGSSLFRASGVRQLIERDGRFMDPGLFLYWDEYEASRRLWATGLPIVVAGGALSWHGKGWIGWREENQRVRQYYVARNAILVVRREFGGPRFWGMFGVRLLRDAAWLAQMLFRGQRPHPRAYLLGTVDGLRGRSGRWSQHRD